MAKQDKTPTAEEQRQSRKEILLARRHRRQTRQIRLAIGAVVALIVLVFIVGIINETVIKPAQPVAVVNDEEIILRDWQERVRFQRAQLVLSIEELAEALNQDIGQVQQFAGQQINLLLEPETLGQLVLDEMIDETIIRQAAQERDITVSEEEVQTEIERNFNYFGGAGPTPQPTATQTPIPTPSLTPVPTTVITPGVATATPFPTPTLGPTATPLPTATPVSEAAFQEQYEDTVERFENLGVDEEEFREVVRAQLYQQQFREELAASEGLPTEAEQAGFFYLTFDDLEEAESALAQIESQDFVTVWNEIRSLPPEEALYGSATARELIWRTQQDIANFLSSEIAATVFTLPLEEPSDIIVEEAATEDETDTFYLVYVTGREVRPLSEREIENAKAQLLQTWLDGRRVTGVETFERWRVNVPRVPVLDSRFLVAPTPAPVTPTIDVPPVSTVEPLEP
ncbi:MAG: SurA N-terminal domain-containing protein [Candidatus Promineifilaceae bacterium]|nr:SurA N-terminal domain-containing protein [Candidatus Promineifilaceae bacterium]